MSTFPAGQPILDSFIRANGALGANWVDGIEADATGLTIVGDAATGVVNGQFAGSGWAALAPVATTAFVTVATLPAAGHQIIVDLLGDFEGFSTILAMVVPSTRQLTVKTTLDGSNTVSLTHFVAGDRIAVTYDPVTALAGAWYYDSAAGTWTEKTTIASTLGSTAGWMLGLETNDTTVRLTNFGGETFQEAVPAFASGHLRP